MIAGAYLTLPVSDRDDWSAKSAAWWSSDGASWTEVDATQFETEHQNSRLTHIAAWAGGFIVAGEQWSGRNVSPTAVAWTSPDGQQWTPITSDAFLGPSAAGATTEVWAAGEEAFITTFTRSDRSSPITTVWSIDRSYAVENIRLIDEEVVAAAYDGRLSVIVTRTGDGVDSEAVRAHVLRGGTWEANDVNVSARTPVALSASLRGFTLTTLGTPPFLLSEDGADWTGPVGPLLSDSDRIIDLATSETGSIAVGLTYVDLDSNHRSGMVWLSDGVRWWAAPDWLGQRFDGDSNTELHHVAFGHDVVVVVGQTGPRGGTEAGGAWYVAAAESLWSPPP